MAENEANDPNVNQLPDPSSFAAVEGGFQKKSSKKDIDESQALNINSLMDIMTIILVFLLKSYSTDPVQLKQAPDLKPPFSTAELKPSESATITVTLNNILVNDGPVMSLEEGKVVESDLSGGGFMIDPLFQKLTDEVEHQKKVLRFRKDKEFTGIVTIIADRHIPFDLLSKVMYTAGQAEFGKFKFMVVKGGS